NPQFLAEISSGAGRQGDVDTGRWAGVGPARTPDYRTTDELANRALLFPRGRRSLRTLTILDGILSVRPQGPTLCLEESPWTPDPPCTLPPATWPPASTGSWAPPRPRWPSHWASSARSSAGSSARNSGLGTSPGLTFAACCWPSAGVPWCCSS